MILTLALITVLRGGTVIDGTGAPPRVADVVMRDGRIACVGRCETPKDAKVVDARGKFVMPGLIDMHVHLLAHPWNEKGDLEPRFDHDTVKHMLRQLLDHGVTTIRDPGSETEAAVTFRTMLEKGAIEGPRLITAGRILNASNFNPEPFKPRFTPEEFREEIRWQKAAGVDLIKIYGSTPPELAKVAIEEAHKLGLPIIGHVARTTWTEAAKLGIDGLEHAAPWTPDLIDANCTGGMIARVCWLENLDLQSPKVQELARVVAEKRVVLDPTLIAMHTKFWGDDPRWTKHPELKNAPPKFVAGWPAGRFTGGWTADDYTRAQKSWPKLLAFVKLLYDRGAMLVAGTDTPTPWIIPGVSLHEELQFLADAGIPPLRILTIATSNAAKALRRNDLGAIEKGRVADVLVLAKDPVKDIANTRSIEMVFKGGRRVTGDR